MKQYAKFISSTEIEMAPINKNGISNYNSENNEAMLFSDGYNLLITSSHEESKTGYFQKTYELINGIIYQNWIFVPYTKEQMENIRAKLYLKEIDPITAQIQRLRDEDPDQEKIEKLLEERSLKVKEIKAEYPDPIEEEIIDDDSSESGESDENN